MCVPKMFQSTTCKHRWLTIGKPCSKDSGFNNCEMFKGGKITPWQTGSADYAKPNTCPLCDMNGEYDGDLMRMVHSDSHRIRFLVPSKKKTYVDVGCVVL